MVLRKRDKKKVCGISTRFGAKKQHSSTVTAISNTSRICVSRSTLFPLSKLILEDLLNLEMIYQWHFSEDTILNAIETQMCNVAALICSSCPVQATWHTRGLLRHGGSAEEAKMSQMIGIAVARVYGARIDNITPVDEIDVNSKTTG